MAAAAQAAGDVTLLINNAGISTGAELVTGDLDLIRREMDTHFWGTVRGGPAPRLLANRKASAPQIETGAAAKRMAIARGPQGHGA
ncbi:hypothetical protein [Actinoplanes sandaracinus]|uniref:hypothetical protein n=1 Tax=Actinoplanes sandaracinus TaxID=3045177 RepID=UPI003899111E